MDTNSNPPGRALGAASEVNHAPTDDIALIEIVNIILKNRRLIVLSAFFLALLTVGFALIQPDSYSTKASFLTQNSGRSTSITSNLAAQFGMTIPGSEGGQSPEFYYNLISTREILGRLADRGYPLPDGDRTTLTPPAELFGIKESDSALVRERTIRALRDHLSIGLDRSTGLITVTATTEWAGVSLWKAENILELIDEFNLEARRSQASAERRFIEMRLDTIEAELRSAENELLAFLQQNRQWEQSSELNFTHDRLQRAVAMHQQVFTSVSQTYEQARIDEVRDTPLITVVEQPQLAVMQDSRRLPLKLFIGMMAGVIFGLIGTLGREFMVRGRQTDSDHFADYEQLKTEALLDLRRPLRILHKGSTSRADSTVQS